MSLLLEKQGLSTQELMVVQSEMGNKRKSKGIAYLLWIFLGSIGGHRFYSGDIGYGFGMFIVWCISWFLLFIPIAIWAIIDLFLIGDRIEAVNEQAERDIIVRIKNNPTVVSSS